jgi:diguanylate cyclase (GGDEF)-like protein
MLGPIITGCAIQTLFYGISMIWVSLAVGLTAIYMATQNEFSYVDTLTGLYNRAYLDYQMETAARDNSCCLGGIMIDVDYFKLINDTYGHSAGDEALIDVARILLFSKPDKATAIRFAGDEFIILMKNASEQQMRKIMEDIKAELDIFNETEGRQYKLSLSLGYAIYDKDNDTSDSFFKHMDDNMYIEKSTHHEKR